MATVVPPRRGEFITETGVPTIRFMEYLETITDSANTATADIVTINNTIGPAARAVYVVSSNHTTTGAELVVCQAALTVTLNPSPVDKELVTVKRDGFNGSLLIVGTIDNGTNHNLFYNGDSVDLFYVAAESSWFII